jgi:GH25 family lysozyme M1 (1,4-beta-N-acetylmuramidase)
MKRKLHINRRPSLLGIGILVLVSSLIAGPCLGESAFAADPVSPPAPAPTATASATPEPSLAPTPSPSAEPVAPDSSPTPSAKTNKTMSEAVGVGGAEMGQRSARVTASKPSGSPGKMTTESLAAEGSWMPTFGIQGLDVSGHQPTVDWQHQWNMGARFAYVKASEGNYYTNPYYNAQYQGSRNIGMIRGAYHFAIPNWSSGADQARFFVQNGGGWSADGYTMPPVLDFEFNPYAGQTINGFKFGNTCYDMSPAQLTAWVKDFGNTMLAMTGRLPVIYTNTSWWNQCLGNPPGFGDYPLWIAAYPGSPTNNAGPVPTGSWSDYSIWQYSSTGPFAGDSNVWNGDYASLQRFATGTPPPVPTDPTRKVVSPGDFDGNGTPDLLKREADGTLWHYPGDGSGKFGIGRKIGDFGWDIYDQVIGAGDFNQDGRNDVLARKIDGSLWFYAGTGSVSASSSGYRAAVKVGEFGWESFDSILGVGDFDSDGKPNLLARTPNGDLYLYSPTAAGQPTAARKIDFGWQVFDQLIAIRDFNGDGINDLAGRKPDGTLWFYSNTGQAVLTNRQQIGAGWQIYSDVVGTGDGNGDNMADFVGVQHDGATYFYAGTWMRDQGYQNVQKIGSFGWDAFDLMVGTKDFDGDAKADLLGRMADGTLWFYPGTGSGAYGAPRKIGNFGWDAFDRITATGDFSGDGKNDIVARKPDGTLWLYRGTGRVDSGSNGYSAAIRIGDFGWDSFDLLVGSGDLDGNGKNDVLARGKDGSLWLYRGTGVISSTNNGYLAGVKIGAFGWEVFDQQLAAGDYNSDGRNDVLARRPDGTLWLYPGNGAGALTAPRRVGTEWNIYDALVTGWNLDAEPHSDFVARRPDGSLWSYSGTGMKPSQGYLGRTFAGAL